MKATKFIKHNMKILGEKQDGKSCIIILIWKQIIMYDNYNTSDSNNNDDGNGMRCIIVAQNVRLVILSKVKKTVGCTLDHEE